MAGKFRTALEIVRNEGPRRFAYLVRLRAARVLTGDTLPSRFPVMGCYRHTDGEHISLYAGYRESMKPLHFLAHANPDGYRLFLRDNSDSFIRMSGLGGAMQFCDYIAKDLAIDIKGKKILDVGCGDGAFAYVLAANGAAEVHGIDVEFSCRRFHPNHTDMLMEAIGRSASRMEKRRDVLEGRVKVYPMDIQTPSVDDRFDIIVSNSVLEHIPCLRTGMAGMCRLLKPHGLMVHRFNPFFSETGGHEYCILDFPWGHVRLSREEIVEYFNAYRAWEKEEAAHALCQSFNDPKLTLNEIDGFAESLGLRPMYASERRSVPWKPDGQPARILSQCRSHYPAITWRDLVSDTVVRVWRMR